MSVLYRRLLADSAGIHRQRTRLRAARMRDMLRLVGPPPRARVIDLGGTWQIWDLIEHDFTITLVNTSPWPRPPERYAGRIEVVVADACDLRGLFASDSFDLAFSNSAIEHVGGPSRRCRFAGEAIRLARSWWVQTPNPLFPIEAHTGMPFYWQWPDWAKSRAEAARRRRMPEWQEEIASTAPVYLEEFELLFPGALIYRERTLGLVKSYSAYRPCRS